MALSTMRLAARPILMGHCHKMGQFSPLTPFIQRVVPMGTSAHEQMNEFWEKNQRLKRPNSPWTIYKFHLPMTTSLTHRISGVVMGVALYTAAIATMMAPGDLASQIEFIKSLNIPMPIMFTFKTIAAFPLFYHYFNGIRHLSWDYGTGFRLSTQYMTGKLVFGIAITLALLSASYSYLV